jgi:hypothetical protein
MQPTERPASDPPPPETSRSRPPGRHAPDPGPRPGDKDQAETAEPHDLPFPGDYRPPRRPEYVIVVDQLRGWQPGQPPSLAGLLGTGRTRTRQPEPDPEAEP